MEDENVEGDDAEDGNALVLTDETQAAVYPSDNSYTTIIIVPPNTDLEGMQSDAVDFHTDLPGPSMVMSVSEADSDTRLNVYCMGLQKKIIKSGISFRKDIESFKT